MLSGLDIVKKLDIRVCVGSDRFHVGQGEWTAMTFNEKHHLVFPLVPTACDYAKLDGYFGKLRKSEIEVVQTQWYFGENLAVRMVAETKIKDCWAKWGNPNR